MLRASNQTTIITWAHTGMRPGYAANHLTTFPSLPVCILGYMRRKPGQRGQQLHLSRSPFQVTGDQGIRMCNVSLSHQPTSETDKGLWPPSHPTCANRADRTAPVLTTVLYLPFTTVLRDWPLANAPQGDGCDGACPKERKMLVMQDTEESGPGAPSSPSGIQQSAMDEQQFVPEVLLMRLVL